MPMPLKKDAIYFPAFLMDLGTSSAILGVTFLASRLGASSLTIGVMASINTILYVFSCQIFGRLSDSISRKRLTQIASLLFSILYLFIPFCKRLEYLIIFFPFTGIFLSAYWPAFEAWIGEFGGKRPLIRRVMMFNLSWTAGLMVGYAGGGFVYSLHTSAPFYFASIAAMLTCIIITFQPMKKEEFEYNVRAETKPNLEPDISLTIRFLYLSRVANFIGWLTLGVMRYIFPKLIYELNISPRIYGLLMLCQAGSQFFMFFILGLTNKWHYRFLPILITQILAFFCFAIIWFSPYPLLWAFALILFGFNTGMTYFSSMYYSLYGHLDLGGKTGWHESIIHSGVFFSTLIGGFLAKYVNLKAPYLFCAIIIILGIPFQLLILNKQVKQTKKL